MIVCLSNPTEVYCHDCLSMFIDLSTQKNIKRWTDNCCYFSLVLISMIIVLIQRIVLEGSDSFAVE